MRTWISFLVAFAALMFAFALTAGTGSLAVSVAIDRVVITDAEQPLATYVFADKSILRPYFANLHAPGGIRVTRHHPPQPGKDAVDHDAMHPGVWLAFGDISGEDFWRNKARIGHKRFLEPPLVREGHVTFMAENELQTSDGRLLALQLSRISVTAWKGAYLLIWQATFTPVGDGFYFGDQEEMGLGVRVATEITEKNGGVILGSTRTRGAAATWGKAFKWCDYSGKIDGRDAGVTLMPAPANFRVSWFHNRDYGLMVANPFGRKAMNQGAASRIEVRKGDSLRLCFGVLLHSGPLDIEAAYAFFLAESPAAASTR